VQIGASWHETLAKCSAAASGGGKTGGGSSTSSGDRDFQSVNHWTNTALGSISPSKLKHDPFANLETQTTVVSVPTLANGVQHIQFTRKADESAHGTGTSEPYALVRITAAEFLQHLEQRTMFDWIDDMLTMFPADDDFDITLIVVRCAFSTMDSAALGLASSGCDCCTVRVFRLGFTLEDAIEFHAFAPA
jgi:hypothetical protein